ncbi:MAG: alcohol dehydrogenase catalytic domain-containing protein [Rhizobiaceae bacterium]|nr:alcohol dehydrogenase catalytic domain-containing protein [Rhizobiaceae bacterium]
MKQQLMTSAGHMELKDVPVPEPGRDEVRIRVGRIGICGSDIHVWHGKHPFTPFPVVQGHEFCGHIDAVGYDVTDIEIGKLVTAMPQIVCGECPSCKKGQFNICENLKVRGFQADGCGQDFFVTKADRIVPLPDDFSLDQGAFMEPVAVAVHAVSRLGNVEGTNIVITGAGPIGNLIAQVAINQGANVLLTDINDLRLERANACGISNTANTMKEPLVQAAQRVFGEGGYSLAVEAAGVRQTIADLVPSINKGGTILIVGVYGDMPPVDLARVGEHELLVKGSMMYWMDDWITARDLLHDGITLAPLIDGMYPLEKWGDAYAEIDRNQQNIMKLMVDVNAGGAH